MRMVFREGRTKAVGSVTKLIPHIPMAEQQSRRQAAKKHHQHDSHGMEDDSVNDRVFVKTD